MYVLFLCLVIIPLTMLLKNIMLACYCKALLHVMLHSNKHCYKMRGCIIKGDQYRVKKWFICRAHK